MKFLLFTTLLLVSVFNPVFGQQSDTSEEQVLFQLDSIKRYGFIDYQENIISHPEALFSFFLKLKSLEHNKDKKIHIFHIGDSHIQADFYTGEVRKFFYQDPRFPYAGRGFIFPYNLAKTNSPFDYSAVATGEWETKNALKKDHFSRWGMSGLNIVTSELSSSVSVFTKNFRGMPVKAHERLRVYFPPNDTASYFPSIFVEHKNLKASYLSNDGYFEVLLKEPIDTVTFGLLQKRKEQSRFLFQGVFLDNDQPGVIYSTVGINGADLKTYLRCADLPLQLSTLKPDLIVISLGTNDAYPYRFSEEKFKENYFELIQRIRKQNPRTPLLLTTAGDNYRSRRYPNKNNQLVQKVCFELLNEFSDIAVWDFYEVMGGFKSIVYWQSGGLARRDKVHLSRKGYEHQGALFYEALMKAYAEYLKKY